MLINSSDKFISYMNKHSYSKYTDKNKTKCIEDNDKVNEIINSYGDVFTKKYKNTTTKKQFTNKKNNSSFKHNKLLLSNKKY